jgi:hypothetical protein
MVLKILRSALKLHPKVKILTFRLLIILLAVHLGCVFGNHAFFWTFNSPNYIVSAYAAHWSKWFLELLNPRMVEYTLEMGIVLALSSAPGIKWVLLGILLACITGIAKRKWTWLAFALFLLFAALAFLTSLDLRV